MDMEILTLSDHSKEDIISQTIEVLRSGGLVIYPTETTYGIGVDATNKQAVDKLLRYKKKRQGKPLSIAVADQKMSEEFVLLNENARNIYSTFLPGPVTVVSKGKDVVAKGVESEQGTLGVRIPNYPLMLEIIRAFGKPITATSANASYKKRPYAIQDILENISEKQKHLIDLILDAGGLPHNDPSTVIDTTLDEPSVLRQGTINFKESMEKITKSAEETQQLGKQFIQKYKNILTQQPLVIALKGPMGAGKTQFVKGIADGLAITRTISSPTFVLAKEYLFEAESQKLQLIHVDAWRMQDEDELEALGFSSWLGTNAVIAIEWAERTELAIQMKQQQAKIIWVELEYGEKVEERKIIFSQ